MPREHSGFRRKQSPSVRHFRVRLPIDSEAEELAIKTTHQRRAVAGLSVRNGRWASRARAARQVPTTISDCRSKART